MAVAAATRYFTMSLARTIRNIGRTGFRQWWRYTYYIGDAKFGEEVGHDQ